jgi:predicted alpha/beta hydrolase
VHALTLTAADGYRLAATCYDARAPLRGHLVVAGATAVPQGFYRRFAEFASARGYTVLTFDYRGIARSRPAKLKGFSASFLDWARLDLAAAVEAMHVDSVPLFLVGHSFGGQALGLLPQPRRVARMYAYGTGSGWHGWMSTWENLRVRFVWSVLLPLLTWGRGYAPTARIGLGQDLPLGVYEQWKRWCGFPHYFFDDPAMRDVAEQFAQVDVPIAAANALDDPWAMPCSRDAFLRGYRSAPIARIDIDPARHGAAIGHMGYFRAGMEGLWEEALRWFGEEAAPHRP